MTRQQIVGQPVDAVLQTIGISQECREAIAARMPFRNLECACSIPGKGELTLNLTLSGIRLAEEALLVIDNITERKRAEDALAEKSMHLDNILRSSTEYAIATTDRDFRITYYNPMAEKIHGYTAEQVIGRTVQEMHTREKVAPERFEEAIENVRCYGEHRYTVVKETPEGKRYIDHRVSGIYDVNGELMGYANFFLDITERKRAEEELHRIWTAIEHTADIVMITDRDGIIQYVNPAFTEVSGYSREEALGKPPRILKSGLQPPEFFESLWKTILSGEVFRATYANRRKDGELYYQVNTITPIKDKQGNITHFVSTAKEITEQRRAEEALRKKEEHHKAVIVGILRRSPFGHPFGKSIFRFVPEGVIVLTESLNLLKQNKAFDDVVQKYAPLLGYTEQELAEKIVEQLRSKILGGDTTEIHIPKKE